MFVLKKKPDGHDVCCDESYKMLNLQVTSIFRLRSFRGLRPMKRQFNYNIASRQWFLLRKLFCFFFFLVV